MGSNPTASATDPRELLSLTPTRPQSGSSGHPRQAKVLPPSRAAHSPAGTKQRLLSLSRASCVSDSASQHPLKGYVTHTAPEADA